MNYKHCLIGLLFSVFFVSCQSDILVKEQRFFNNNTWTRFEMEKFQIDVNNVDDCYDIYLNLAIDTAFMREDVIPLSFSLNAPNGERRMFRTLVNIKNKNGLLLGEKGDDGYIYFEHKARDYFFFNNKGVYNVEVGQATNRYELRGVKSLELVVEKAELVYPE